MGDLLQGFDLSAVSQDSSADNNQRAPSASCAEQVEELRNDAIRPAEVTEDETFPNLDSVPEIHVEARAPAEGVQNDVGENASIERPKKEKRPVV